MNHSFGTDFSKYCRCDSLHSVLEDTHSKWAAQERHDEDDLVTHSLRELATTTNLFCKSIRRKLEAGVGPAEIPRNSANISVFSTSRASIFSPSLSSMTNSISSSQVAQTSVSPSQTQLSLSSSQAPAIDQTPTPPSPTSLSSPEDSNISNISINMSTNSIHSGNIIEASSNVHSGNIMEANAARLAQLHRQREHWRLEYHLLSHKHAKLMKLVKDSSLDSSKALTSGAAKVERSSILGEVQLHEKEKEEFSLGDKARNQVNGSDESTGKHSKHSDDKKTKEASDSKAKDAKESTSDEAESWRESMIRHHLTGRCSKLFLELTKACSKATLFQDECEAALKRLAETEATTSTLESELESVR